MIHPFTRRGGAFQKGILGFFIPDLHDKALLLTVVRFA